MTRTIDVEGLSEEQVKLVEEFVEFLKNRRKELFVKKGKEEVAFATHRSGVKGRITRDEIYDYL